MSKKKKKRSTGIMPFVVLWCLTYLFGWLSAFGLQYLIMQLLPELFTPFPDSDVLRYLFFSIGGGIIGLIAGGLQQFLLSYQFKLAIRRWWLWTALTSFAAAGILFLYNTYLWLSFNRLLENDNHIHNALVMGMLFMFPALAQAWLLRKHTRQATLWVIAALASGTTFALAPFQLMIAGSLQGIVMALTLVWLFGMTGTEAAAQAYDTNRLQAKKKPDDDNLQDAESTADAILVELEKRQVMESES